MEVINSCSLVVFAVAHGVTVQWISEWHTVNLGTSGRQNIILFNPLFSLSIPVSHFLTAISSTWSSSLPLIGCDPCYFLLSSILHCWTSGILDYTGTEQLHLTITCGTEFIYAWVLQKSELKATFGIGMQRHKQWSSLVREARSGTLCKWLFSG